MKWWSKKAGVYEILNLANGKRYIGSTNQLRRRLAEHKRHLTTGRHASRHLQAAWNKYGSSSFVFRPLVVCDPRHRVAYEQDAIDWFKAGDTGFGYNGRTTANAPAGVPRSEETRRKISASNTGKVFTQSHREAISKACTGRVTTVETRAKLSLAGKGKAKSKEHIRKVAESHRNKKRSAETCARISAAKKGKPSSKKGVPMSPESREKMKLAWARRKTQACEITYTTS